VASAREALAAAQNRLDLISPKAPTAARVQDVFYQAGEWTAANQPVVALLADDRVRLRFFVPEAEVARYRPGRRSASIATAAARPARRASTMSAPAPNSPRR
jgi:HlyD family secretion protein